MLSDGSGGRHGILVVAVAGPLECRVCLMPDFGDGLDRGVTSIVL